MFLTTNVLIRCKQWVGASPWWCCQFSNAQGSDWLRHTVPQRQWISSLASNILALCCVVQMQHPSFLKVTLWFWTIKVHAWSITSSFQHFKDSTGMWYAVHWSMVIFQEIVAHFNLRKVHDTVTESLLNFLNGFHLGMAKLLALVNFLNGLYLGIAKLLANFDAILCSRDFNISQQIKILQGVCYSQSLTDWVPANDSLRKKFIHMHEGHLHLPARRHSHASCVFAGKHYQGLQ